MYSSMDIGGVCNASETLTGTTVVVVTGVDGVEKAVGPPPVTSTTTTGEEDAGGS